MNNNVPLPPWRLQTLGMLEFGQVTLDSWQIEKLRGGVNQRALDALNAVFDGYSRVLNTVQDLSNQQNLEDLKVETDEKGDIFIHAKGLKSAVKAGNLRDFPELARAMATVCVIAKRHFPSTSLNEAALPSPMKKPSPLTPAAAAKQQAYAAKKEIKSLALDTNILSRNVMNVSGVVWPELTVPSALGTGVGNLYNGWQEWKGAGKSLAAATAIRDLEGQRLAEFSKDRSYARIPMGACQISSNSLSLVNLATKSSLVASISHIFGMFGSGLLIVANIISLGSLYFYQWSEISEFRSNFQAIGSRAHHSDQQKVLNGLTFLRDQLVLTEEEEMEITLSVAVDKQKLRENKWQEKYERLTRRVGEDQVRLIAEQADDLIAGLKDPAAVDQCLSAAKDLIEKTDRAIFKIRVRQYAVIAASILGIAAATWGLCSGGIVLASALFILTTLIWISLDSSKLHNAIANCFWKACGDWSKGSSVSVDQFMPNMVQRYASGNNCKLQTLRTDIESSLQFRDFYINGTKVETFAACCLALGLEKLNWADNQAIIQDQKQASTLMWLMVMQAQASEQLLQQAKAQAPDKNPSTRWSTVAGQKTRVDLWYNRQTDRGKMIVCQEAEVMPVGVDPYRIKLFGEVSRMGARAWAL